MKIVRLVEITLKTTMVKIRTEINKKDNFTVNKKVKQGDSLSATLFD